MALALKKVIENPVLTEDQIFLMKEREIYWGDFIGVNLVKLCSFDKFVVQGINLKGLSLGTVMEDKNKLGLEKLANLIDGYYPLGRVSICYNPEFMIEIDDVWPESHSSKLGTLNPFKFIDLMKRSSTTYRVGSSFEEANTLAEILSQISNKDVRTEYLPLE